ncbi:MAG: helix-turn-helix domain-containing protein [Fusobacteriaceae bacterium]
MSTTISKEKLESVGLYIKNKRVKKGYGLLEFANNLGISGAYLSTLESGKHPKINPLLLKKIASLLSFDYLILYKIVGYSDVTMEDIEFFYPTDEKNINELIRLGNSLNGKELDLVLKYINFIKDNK